MTAKLLFSCSIFSLGSNVLFAQSSLVMQTKNLDGLEVSNAVQFLSQNALMALIGIVIFIGLTWFCAVMNACKELKKAPKQSSSPSLSLLILMVGLSVFGQSCSAEQRARATEYRIAAESAYRNCPLRQQHQFNASIPFNNRYYSTSASNIYGPVFCKHCGYKIRGGY